MDELSKQLTIETQTPLPAKPGRPECFDYEYVRNGTGFIIRRNRFRAQMRSAMVLRASGLVENNQIDGVGGLGVYITNDLPPFPEGPVPGTWSSAATRSATRTTRASTSGPRASTRICRPWPATC
jgi:hypothetical protein